MIPEFSARFTERLDWVREQFKANHPDNYDDIVRIAVQTLVKIYRYKSPDPGRIHRIDDGDYQGTLLYLIASDDYQPDTYWYVFVSYGSCSGCDTLQAICDDYPKKQPTDEQVAEYVALATHIIQGMNKISAYFDGEVE